MIFGGLEILFLKGAAVLVKAVAAGKAVALAKAGPALASYLASHGVAATVSLVATGTFVSCIVVGGVYYTVEMANCLKQGFIAIKEGDYEEALSNFLAFQRKSNIDLHDMPEHVEAYLKKIGHTAEQADVAVKAMKKVLGL